MGKHLKKLDMKKIIFIYFFVNWDVKNLKKLDVGDRVPMKNARSTLLSSVLLEIQKSTALTGH